MYVSGSGTYVQQVKGRGVWIGAGKTATYHFQMWASGWSHNTPDKTHSQAWGYNGYIDSEWVTANRHVPAGSAVCSRLWVYYNGGWNAPGEAACLKITA